MEMRRTTTNKGMMFFGLLYCMLLFMHLSVSAQPPKKTYTIRNGKMYVELSKSLSDADLDAFIQQFNLNELALKRFIREDFKDSIHTAGWEIEKNTKQLIAISKGFISSDNLNKPGEQLILSVAERFPPQGNGVVMGYNKFRKNKKFFEQDSLVRFFLPGFQEANRVILAGSFNNFSPTALPMQKTDSGWIANVILQPGKYWYKFIHDGNWITDPQNLQNEDDGEGNENSVFYKSNYVVQLKGYQQAHNVYLAGSFNNWQRKNLAMQPADSGWALPLYLANGTYTYRFVVDKEWMADPNNPEKMPNEFGEYNSVIRLGTPHLFRLTGFTSAKKVLLTGSFNQWRKDELFLTKTETGWEIMYTLGEGNYEYRFIVDDKDITDPANELYTKGGLEKGNSILILGANHTFRLTGYPNAKQVIVAGDFNQFNPEMLVMKKEGDAWVMPVHLTLGKHIYKYIVDGEWIIDPGNRFWEQNEYGTGNSVLWMETDGAKVSSKQ